MKELELNVTGMKCGGCENRVKNAVSEIKDVKKVEASHETGKVNILFKKEVDESIKNEIRKNIERMEEFKVID